MLFIIPPGLLIDIRWVLLGSISMCISRRGLTKIRRKGRGKMRWEECKTAS
jgi:hypothetical protein